MRGCVGLKLNVMDDMDSKQEFEVRSLHGHFSTAAGPNEM